MPGLGCSMWDLVPSPWIAPGPPALGVRSLSHWTMGTSWETGWEGQSGGREASGGSELSGESSPGSGLGVGHAHTPRVRALLVEQRCYHELKCPSERKCVCTPRAASMLHLTQWVCFRRMSQALGLLGFFLAIPQGIWNLSP